MRERLKSLILLLVLSTPLLSSSAPAGDANPSTTGLEVQLRYREVDYAPLVWEIGIERVSSFTKEPAVTNQRVFRGRLMLGTDTNQFVPFLWNIDLGKLHLDLNRNGDLTDDPGPFVTESRKEVQLFRGLRLQFAGPQGEYQVLADAHIFEQGGAKGAVRVFLYVRSLWEGELELDGKRWYVAVIDRPDGRIGSPQSLKEIGDRMVLRPWEERERPFLWWHATLHQVHGFSHVKLVTYPYRYAGNAEVFDAFNLPANLFFQGQAYHLKCQTKPVDGAKPADLALTLQPFFTSLGEMRLNGDCVQRVVLDNSTAPDGFAVVLDRPTAQVQVPLGAYPRQLVLLQRAGFTNVAVGLGTNEVSVTESNLADFRAGGPLVNRVQPQGLGYYGGVRLNYQLLNHAEIPFHLAFQDEAKPPRFEIRQGDRLVETGTFGFG